MQAIHLEPQQLIQILSNEPTDKPDEDTLHRLAQSGGDSPALAEIKRKVDAGIYEMPEDDVFELVDEILWCQWDPIGVNGMEECRDEYAAMVYDITLICCFGTIEQLAAELFFNERYYLGLESDTTAERSCQVASVLMESYQHSKSD